MSFALAVSDAYYHLSRKSLPSATLFTSGCNLHHYENNFQFDDINHRIAKGSQGRCSLPGCKETSVYYCKKWNFSLHAECLALYHF